jgi:hypothetical protein
MGSRLTLAVMTAFAFVPLQAQVLEFDSNGLHYKALTRSGVTVMFAPLPTKVLGYAILQVAISNGSPVAWNFRPEDFSFEREGGTSITAMPAGTVVRNVLNKAGHGDITRLIQTYESALYGNTQFTSTNGYESRRLDAMTLNAPKLKGAAAAAAIALVTTKLAPGQSTDGAIFYPNSGKPLGAGRVIVNAAGEIFEFPMAAEPAHHSGS